ncbi:MAG: hypothetical protein K2L83_03255 [Muribaculaceae bacterium]|nr:hypothetical protein [Muribaculaceae bacterium]
MKLTLPTGLLTLAVVAGMALPPFDADAGYGKIYLTDSSDPYHEQTAPIVQNEEYYENRTLVETSPNIYEGYVSLSSPSFYFSKQLFDCDYSQYNSNYRNREIIVPNASRSQMRKIGNIDVFTSSDVHDITALTQPHENWQLTIPGDYRMIVDLNENTIHAVRQESYAIVMDGQPAPTPATIKDYHCVGETFYIRGGFSFRFYDLYSDEWLNAEGGDQDAFNLNEFITTPGTKPGYLFNFDQIEEAILSFVRERDVLGHKTFNTLEMYDSGYEREEGKPVEALQFTGNANNWGTLENAFDCEKLDEEGYLWRATLPVGTDDFIFVVGDWELSLGMGYFDINNDGSYTGYLSEGTGYYYNIDFDYPLTEEVCVDIDLRNNTIYLPANAPLENMTNRFHSQTTRDDIMYVFTPHDAIIPYKGMWEGMWLYALDEIQLIQRNPGTNTYEGKIRWTASPEQNDGIAIAKTLTPADFPNIVITPAGDEDLIVGEACGEFYANGKIVESNDLNYFCLNSSLFGVDFEVNLTVNLDGDQPIVKFEFLDIMPKQDIEALYFCDTFDDDYSGNPQESDLKPIEKISNNVFYGTFSIDPSQSTLFRFFVPTDYEGEYSFLGVDDITSISDGKWEGPIETSTWVIRKNTWPSDRLYVLVDLSETREGTVKFSSTPIDVQRLRNKDKEIYLPLVSNNGEVDYLASQCLNDGTQYFEYFAQPGIDYDPRSRKLPFSPKEPEWDSSYSFSLADGQSIEFDEYGIAEFDLKTITEISTEKVNPIRFEPEEIYTLNFRPSSGVLYIDPENQKGYIERVNSRMYIIGEMTDITEGTIKDRRKLMENSVDYRGGMFYFPPGNQKFALTRFIPDVAVRFNHEPVKVDIHNQFPYYVDPDNHVYLQNVDYELENWEGGSLFVCGEGVFDLHDIKRTMVETAGLGESSKWISMTQSKDNHLIYTAAIPYTTTPGEICGIRFWSDIHYGSLVFGNGSMWTSSPLTYFGDEGPLTETDNVKRLNSSNPYYFILPTLKGSGVLYVTVNLEDMTLTADFSEAESGNVYEVVSVGNPAIDGVEVYPAQRRENAVAVELDLNTASGEACEFNFTSAQGDVIVPAEGESEIVFGEDGFWIGNYTTVPSTRARARGVARAKETSKWNVNLPKYVGDKVNFLIDETEKKMVAYSSDCNTTTFYMEVKNNGRETDAASIDVYDTLSALVKDDDGIYRGSFEVEAQKTDVPAEVLFVKELSNTGGYYKGIFNCETSQSVIDITNEKSWDGVAIDSQFGEPVTPSTYRFTSDERMKVEVEYDPMTNAICFNPTFLGMEEVAATDNAVSVYGAHGCLIVSAGSPATLTVYNLQGMAVKTVAVGESTLRIPLSPGLYIVAGKKVVVK